MGSSATISHQSPSPELQSKQAARGRRRERRACRAAGGDAVCVWAHMRAFGTIPSGYEDRQLGLEGELLY